MDFLDEFDMQILPFDLGERKVVVDSCLGWRRCFAADLICS